MASRRTRTQMLGAAACVVLGMGALQLNAPAKAQAPAAEASTAQPPGSSDLDTNFWSLVRDSNDPAALQSYLHSFPTGKFADVARQRMTALREQQDRNARPAPSPSSETDRVEMARYHPPSSPAPQLTPWQPATPTAAAHIAARAEACRLPGRGARWRLGRTKPRRAQELRTPRQGRHSRRRAEQRRARRRPGKAVAVCPIVCDSDEKLVGERCVAVPKPVRPAVKEQPTRREQQRREQPRRTWAERPSAESSESRGGNSGKRLCFGARPNELVTCP